jgi:oxygen-independent coproporphyrinogen III oxidase
VKPRFIYIHVPFCVRRCSYCDFAVDAVREPPVHAWLASVEAELRLIAEAERWSGPLELETIYVGGGTPSLLGTGAMAALRRVLTRWASWDPATVEWTAEANPESFTPDVAEDWREAGVNRVSLGAQTFHEPALRWMGRLHGVDGPARAVEAARRAGFASLSIDLIFGLPARLERDWGADLETTLTLAPEHVSLYGLTAEPATPLGRRVAQGRERLAGEATYEAEYLAAAERLPAAGFHHYEVSNFGLPGHESRHNRAYWTGAAYVGLGPGAHSFQPPVRRWNVRDWLEYRNRLASGRAAEEGREHVSGEAAELERAWLGLRTSTGLDLGAAAAAGTRVDRWVAAWWARRERERVVLTPRGWLLLDRLAVDLAGELEPPGTTPVVSAGAGPGGHAVDAGRGDAANFTVSAPQTGTQ